MRMSFFKSVKGVEYVTDLNCRIIKLIDEKNFCFYYNRIKIVESTDVSIKIDAVVQKERAIRTLCHQNNWMDLYVQMMKTDSMVQVLFTLVSEFT